MTEHYVTTRAVHHDNKGYGPGQPITFDPAKTPAHKADIHGLILAGAIKPSAEFASLKALTLAKLTELATAEGIQVGDEPDKSALISLIIVTRGERAGAATAPDPQTDDTITE